MKVRLAKKTGFCFGVRRAIDIAERALIENKKVYSLGSIIHNRQVVAVLSKKGLKVIKDINAVRDGAILISSHGISPNIAKRIKDKGLRLIDTTCPFVLKAQTIAGYLSDSGYNVIIVGEKSHPEVKALVDFVTGQAHVVKNAKEAGALKLKSNEKYSIISQTTQSSRNFMDVVKAVLAKKPREIRIINTICKDAEDRQSSARALARTVDVMLVIGGKNSANTNRLFEVCKSALKDSHLLETEDELKTSWFRGSGTIGITSGASTPDWIVKKVVNKLKKKGVA